MEVGVEDGDVAEVVLWALSLVAVVVIQKHAVAVVADEGAGEIEGECGLSFGGGAVMEESDVGAVGFGVVIVLDLCLGEDADARPFGGVGDGVALVEVGGVAGAFRGAGRTGGFAAANGRKWSMASGSVLFQYR